MSTPLITAMNTSSTPAGRDGAIATIQKDSRVPAVCNANRVARHALFVFDQDNWCSVFADAEDSAGQLETNDVEAGEYVVFDQVGVVYEIWTEGLHVRLRPSEERDVAKLRARVRRFLEERSVPATM